MKRFNDSKDDLEGTNYWFPISNIVAAFVVVILIIAAAGFVLYSRIVDEDLIAANQGQSQQQGNNQAGNNQDGQTGNGQSTGQTGQTSNGQSTNQAGQSGNGQSTNQVNLSELQLKEQRLSSQAAALKKYTDVRTSIISELSSKFKSIGAKADIDLKTGSIRFGQAVLFEVNNSKISASGQSYLKKIIPAYLNIVLSQKYLKYFDKIVVEGHADDGGSYLYNLALSQERSYSVINYIMSNKLTRLSDGRSAEKYFAISGKSYSEPVLVNGNVNKTMSRRVELAFVLKYDEMIEDMQEILKGGVK